MSVLPLALGLPQIPKTLNNLHNLLAADDEEDQSFLL
jgi:hypothetical protein